MNPTSVDTRNNIHIWATTNRVKNSTIALLWNLNEQCYYSFVVATWVVKTPPPCIFRQNQRITKWFHARSPWQLWTPYWSLISTKHTRLASGCAFIYGFFSTPHGRGGFRLTNTVRSSRLPSSIPRSDVRHFQPQVVGGRGESILFFRLGGGSVTDSPK